MMAASVGSSSAGVRPNSVVQTTSVSSSMPRDFKSFSSPAMGLSTFRASGSCVRMLGARPNCHSTRHRSTR